MTDMWERFGFFGLQSLLVLFAAASSSKGGLGLSTADAAAMTGAWIGLTYMLGSPGGWAADRVLGVRRAMQLGGVIITLGHFSMAVPAPAGSAAGLLLVSIGAGLYKPNHQAMTNMMYGDSDRRESGISLMYMGVQISALAAPLIVGVLGEFVSYQAAFLCTGLVMLFGVGQFARAVRQFGDVGARPGRPLDQRERAVAVRWSWILAGAITTVVVLGIVGHFLNLAFLLAVFGMCSLAAPLVAYVMLYRHKDLTARDRQRMRTYRWVLLVWTMFFMIIAQGGSVLLLFVKDSVDREVLGFTVPTSWFTAASPLFLLLLSPVFAWLLPRIRGGVPTKFAIALLIGGTSFLMMAIPAALAADGDKVSPAWMLLVYFMHSCGELIIIAVAISTASDILPRAFISQTIGMLGLFGAFGGGLGSMIVLAAQSLPATAYYLSYGLVASSIGLIVALRRRGIARGLARQEEPATDGAGTAEQGSAEQVLAEQVMQ